MGGEQRHATSLPKGFAFLVSAQFFSGLADNAVLILAMAFLHEQGYPVWWAPLMKLAFTLSYVLLAPVLGPLADAFPKARLMACLNALKLMGLLLMPLGVHPALSFALIGLAAAAYAPAKYGLMIESVSTRQLVHANAWLEVSVVLSVILGTVLGGVLVGLAPAQGVRHVLAAWSGQVLGLSSELLHGFAAVALVYLLAAALNMGIAPPARRRTLPLRRAALSWRTFVQGHLRLWRDPLGGLSLYVTTLYWGVGAVMQFVVLNWAQTQLGLSLAQGAYLQATVAIGVVLGATLAGRIYRVHSARRALPMGLLLALLLPSLIWIESLLLAIPVLLLAGVVGGVLLVPMNALMQHRGGRVLSTGRSVAVQGFNENASVLLMLGLYSAALAAHLPLWVMLLFLSLMLVLGLLPVYRPWQQGR